MVIVLAPSAVDPGFEFRSDQTKDYKIGSTTHWGERAKTGWLGIRIKCPSGATCQSVDWCFSKLALKIQQSVLV